MKKYEITKEQVLELADLGYENKLKKWFPEVFKTELEVGKWYKWENGKALFNYQEDGKVYGFLYGKWHVTDYWTWEDLKNIKEATEQEVFEALKNEAVKRGFKEDIYILSPVNKFEYKIIDNTYNYSSYDNILSIGSFNIFMDGKWAEIIPTLTKKEAEEKLNCKII